MRAFRCRRTRTRISPITPIAMKATSPIIPYPSFTAVGAMARVGSHSRNLRTAATAAR